MDQEQHNIVREGALFCKVTLVEGKVSIPDVSSAAVPRGYASISHKSNTSAISRTCPREPVIDRGNKFGWPSEDRFCTCAKKKENRCPFTLM